MTRGEIPRHHARGARTGRPLVSPYVRRVSRIPHSTRRHPPRRLVRRTLPQQGYTEADAGSIAPAGTYLGASGARIRRPLIGCTEAEISVERPVSPGLLVAAEGGRGRRKHRQDQLAGNRGTRSATGTAIGGHRQRVLHGPAMERETPLKSLGSRSTGHNALYGGGPSGSGGRRSIH